MTSPASTHDRDGANREWLPGVKLVDAGLVVRMQRVVDRFRAATVTVVSGYRPSSIGSFHFSARALDFRLEGVKNEDLVAFCRSLGDTGCGYYPNSSFIHMDVRPKGTGHVYWIDSSGPGETPHYVSAWPPPRDEFGRAVEVPAPAVQAPSDEHTHEDLGRIGSSMSAQRKDASDSSPRAEDPFRP